MQGHLTWPVARRRADLRLAGNVVWSGVVRAVLRWLGVMLIGSVLAGCLMMEGSAPDLKRSDLAVLPDYSGSYVSYALADHGGIVPALPGHLMIFDRLAEGEYRFAVQSADDKLPVFGGFLYLLDIGAADEAVGIIYARSRQGEQQVVFVQLRRVSETRFDLAGFIQNNSAKYAVLQRVAHRHGIQLDPKQQGQMRGRPSGAQLRAAYADPQFRANVEVSFKTTFVQQDAAAAWPERVVIKEVVSLGLKLSEDSPAWQAAGVDGQCTVSYGAPDAPPLLAVHAVRGRFALELRLPEEAGTARERVSLRWQVDGGRRHLLTAERPILAPDTLVSFPFETRLIEELARGQQLTIAGRGLETLRLPLDGSARASMAFSRCLAGQG